VARPGAAVYALDQKPLPPFADGIFVQAQFARDEAVGLSRDTFEHHACALRERLRRVVPINF